LGLIFALVAVALMAMPSAYYLIHRSVTEWMIYRFVVSSLLASSACLLLASAYLTRKIVTIVLSDAADPRPARIANPLSGILFWTLPATLVLVGGGLVMPSFIELVRSGSTYEHWSRFIAMSCLVSCALILVVARIFDYSLDLLAARVAYLRGAGDTEATDVSGERQGPSSARISRGA